MARRQRRRNANTAESARPLQRKFGWRPLLGKLKACQTVVGGRAQRHPRIVNAIIPPDPGRVAEFWHPSRMQPHRLPTGGLRSAATPGYCLPTLRVTRLLHAVRHPRTIIQQTNRQYIEPFKSYCQDSYHQKLTSHTSHRPTPEKRPTGLATRPTIPWFVRGRCPCAGDSRPCAPDGHTVAQIESGARICIGLHRNSAHSP